MKDSNLAWKGIAAALFLAGCASQPPAQPSSSTAYVALLKNADGSVGEVNVKQGTSEVKLDKPMQAATLGGASSTAFQLDEARLQKDFGQAMSALPPAPAAFVLRFAPDGARLLPESEPVIPKVAEAVKGRPAPEVIVTGYFDYRELSAWNNIDNTTTLPIGQVLALAPPAAGQPGPTHTVVAGDTLSGIAAKYGEQRVQSVAQRLRGAGIDSRAVTTVLRNEATDGPPGPPQASATRRVDITIR
jgi:LysM repeat protein